MSSTLGSSNFSRSMNKRGGGGGLPVSMCVSRSCANTSLKGLSNRRKDAEWSIEGPFEINEVQ